jgi:lipopolysaccharide transport system ATP-binding protein
MRMTAARTLSGDKITADVIIDQPTTVEYDFEVLEDGLYVSSSIHLFDKHETCILVTGTTARELKRGIYRHSCVFPANFLNDASYTVTIFLITDVTRHEVVIPHALSFFVHETKARGEYLGAVIGCIRPTLEWNERSLNGSVAPAR